MGRTIVVAAVIAALSGTGISVVTRAARAGGAPAAARRPPRAQDTLLLAPETALASPRRAAAVRDELSRLRAAALSFVELGYLAGVVGATPELRAYGHQLVEEFRGFDAQVTAWAAARDLSPVAIAPVADGAAEETSRHRAERLAMLGALRGDLFDRGFWVALARDQSTVSEVAATLRWSASDPGVATLASALSDELDQAQGGLLSVARLDFPALPR